MDFQYNAEISLEEANQVLDIEQKVMHRIQQQGFIIPDKPVYQDQHGQNRYFEGDIPHDLTTLSEQQLGFYMSMVTGWMSYVGVQKTLADMRRTVAKEKLETFQAKLRLKNKEDEEGKRRSNPERDDVVNSHRQVVEAKSIYMELDAFYTIVSQVYKNAESKYAAISRRITQTTSDNSRANRNVNVANMPKPGGHPLFRGGRGQ